MDSKRVLVFPCGSEIALEIYRSVSKSIHFDLIGASSVDDHGKFVYENYISGVPFVNDSSFLVKIKEIVKTNQIDAIYPAMDSVIDILKSNEDFVGCKIIASNPETTKICLSKKRTYSVFKNVLSVPKLYESSASVKSYPVFSKPDVGYGSRGAKLCHNKTELDAQLNRVENLIICEYLPGAEYTVDCFTNSEGTLLYASPRERLRIMNGISVNTKPVYQDVEEFISIASTINSKIRFRGAWFFQVKRDINNELVLLEIASRFGGSSSLCRAKGVNFALMSLYDAFNIPVSIIENDYAVEMDRALDNKYIIDLSYDEVFVDFDDCLYLESKKINPELIEFLFRCLNKGIKLTLLSKHDDEKSGDFYELLSRWRISQLFDRIIHVKPDEEKFIYIDNVNSIFIDDSFSERKKIKEHCGINVFSVDMVGCL